MVADLSCGAREAHVVAEINGVVVSASPAVRARDRKPVAVPVALPEGAPPGQLALSLVADGREADRVACVYAAAPAFGAEHLVAAAAFLMVVAGAMRAVEAALAGT